MKITIHSTTGESTTIEIPDRTPFIIRSEEEEKGKAWHEIEATEKELETIGEAFEIASKENTRPWRGDETEEPTPKKPRKPRAPRKKTKMDRIELLYLEGKNTAEIAKAVGSTPGSVSSTINRLKKRWRISETRQPRGEEEQIILTKTQKELIHDMHKNSEYSDAEIAAELDLPLEDVKKELKHA